MIQKIVEELGSNSSFYVQLLIEHIGITFISVIIATIVGLAIGIWISQNEKMANSVISVVNIAYTIPSIALLGFLISFTGVGNTTAIIALIIYALLPIVRGTYVGITTIDSKIIEASRAMGSTDSQILWKIQLPLAFPVIHSSIMNMVTMTIALAGIASFVGAGGLGVAIYRGITTNNEVLIWIGGTLIALLALVIDRILGAIGKLVEQHKIHTVVNKRMGYAVGLLLIVMGSVFGLQQYSKHDTIHIASKPVSEGYILAEIVGTLIEADTNLKVEYTHGVGGGTSNIHPGMVRGDFDMYPEYTGTSWQVILKHQDEYKNDKFSMLTAEYKDKYHFLWKGMFGFNDTYSIGIRADLAKEYGIKTFTDLAKYAGQLTFGAEYDFFEREDGYKALANAYNYHFKKEVDMDNGLKYQALFDKKIDAMTVFTTDGQLSDPRVVVLEDDRNLYPSYMAGMVVREETLQKHPELETVLHRLDGILDESTMAQLNKKVEIDKEDPKQVAREFLQSKGLVAK